MDNMSSSPRRQLDEYLANLEIDCERVLDVGGSQVPLTGRVNKLECDEYKILDLEKPHRTAQEPDIVHDINERWNGFSEYDEAFDVVTCFEVFDYVWNPVQALSNIRKFLKKGGIAYISFPFIYPIHEPMEEDMLRFTKFGVERLLEKTGFEVKEITHRVADSDLLQRMYKTEKMRMSSRYDIHDDTGYIVKAQAI